MRRLLNTLYVTSEDAWLRKDGANLVVEVEGVERGRAPLHMLNGVVSFGRAGASPALLAACAEALRIDEPTRLRDLTQKARDYLRQSPLRAKDKDGHEHTMDHFFIHGLSHYLGMDVHDVGDTSRPIEPGEVFTIEPGLYIPAEDLGVRIEDDYLMTRDGLEKLTESIPSDPDEVERLIARARAARSTSAERADDGGERKP